MISYLILWIERSQFDFPWPKSFWTPSGQLCTNQVAWVRFLLMVGLVIVCPSTLIHLSYDLMTTWWIILLECCLCLLPTVITFGLGMLMALGGALRATG